MSKCFNKYCAYCKDYVCTFNDGKNIEECCWYEKEIKTSSVSDIVDLSNREMDGLLDDYAKRRIADLEAKLAELNKEPLNCSQLENGMSLCVIQKSKIAELEDYYTGYTESLVAENLDLKQQLELKETELGNMQSMYESVTRSSAMYFKENVELREQLTEKQKEIKNLVLAHFESDANKPVLTTTEIINQDKISFAVEKLEKVKEKLNDYDIQEILSSSSDPYGEFDENCVTTDKINTIIDNQIKELKKEMK